MKALIFMALLLGSSATESGTLKAAEQISESVSPKFSQPSARVQGRAKLLCLAHGGNYYVRADYVCLHPVA